MSKNRLEPLTIAWILGSGSYCPQSFLKCADIIILQLFYNFDMQNLQNDKLDQIGFFRNCVQAFMCFSTSTFIINDQLLCFQEVSKIKSHCLSLRLKIAVLTSRLRTTANRQRHAFSEIYLSELLENACLSFLQEGVTNIEDRTYHIYKQRLAEYFFWGGGVRILKISTFWGTGHSCCMFWGC